MLCLWPIRARVRFPPVANFLINNFSSRIFVLDNNSYETFRKCFLRTVPRNLKMRINVNLFITDVKRKKSNLEKKIYFYEKRPKRRWTKLSKFYVLITKAKKFYSGMIPKYGQKQWARDGCTRIFLICPSPCRSISGPIMPGSNNSGICLAFYNIKILKMLW